MKTHSIVTVFSSKHIHFRTCDEKNFGVSSLCNLDLRAGLPKPQIWGTQVLDQLGATYSDVNPAPGENIRFYY